MLRAFELHVLDEMRQPLLVVVLEDRPGPDHEAQLGPAGGLPVRANVVAEAVRQRADRDLRVHRHQLVQGIGGNRRGRCFAPGAWRLGRCHRPGGKDAGDHTDNDAEARHSHASHPNGGPPVSEMPRVDAVPTKIVWLGPPFLRRARTRSTFTSNPA